MKLASNLNTTNILEIFSKLILINQEQIVLNVGIIRKVNKVSMDMNYRI